MNMIPLVMANEPGRAHFVNLRLRRIVVCSSVTSVRPVVSLFGKKRQRG